MKKRYWIFLLCLPLGWVLWTSILFPSVVDDGVFLVAVIDSGVDYEHEDLKGRVIKGFDFIDLDQDPMDENGHGTHVATQILNKTKETQVLAIRTLDEEGKGRGKSLFGVLYAIIKGADIINMSYSESYHPYMPFLIWLGEKRGILFVASTGNEGKEEINYPAKYKGVLPIGAIDQENGELYEGSNFDKEVTFVAPGVAVEGADIDNGHSIRTGTSMAAGYTSGILAYLIEQHPTYSKKQLLSLLQHNSTPTNDGKFQQLDYARFAAMYEKDVLYAQIHPTQAFTEQEVYLLPVDTINIDHIEIVNEFERRLLTTNQWEANVSVPLLREGYQYITLRFYQGEHYQERSFGVTKDTQAPMIDYVHISQNLLSFIVTDTTLKEITVNGENANRYIRANRRKDHTYHVVKPMNISFPIVLEVQDKIGHKTKKVLYDLSEN